MVFLIVENNGALMKTEDYRISKLSYIESGGNEIMEKYQIRV